MRTAATTLASFAILLGCHEPSGNGLEGGGSAAAGGSAGSATAASAAVGSMAGAVSTAGMTATAGTVNAGGTGAAGAGGEGGSAGASSAAGTNAAGTNAAGAVAAGTGVAGADGVPPFSCDLCCPGGAGHPTCAVAFCACPPEAGTGAGSGTAGSGVAGTGVAGADAEPPFSCDLCCPGGAGHPNCALADCICPPEAGTSGGVLDGCFIGGCSSQLCSNEPGGISTCEWREAYACYQTATCERQDGACGWTLTDELQACLASANGI